MSPCPQTRTLPRWLSLLCLFGAVAMVVFGLGLAAFSNLVLGGRFLASVSCTGGGVFLALWMLPEWMSHVSRVKHQVTEPSRVTDAPSKSAIDRASTACDLPRESAVVIQFPVSSRRAT